MMLQKYKNKIQKNDGRKPKKIGSNLNRTKELLPKVKVPYHCASHVFPIDVDCTIT